MIWDIDPAHSQVSFALPFMRVMKTRGQFKTLRGRLHIDEQQPTHSWMEAEVEAASINTHNWMRDTHLRSNDFFAVKQYPKITFQSTQVEQVSDKDYRVTGNLTLRGVTHPVTFAVTHRAQQEGLSARAHLSASATINRHDFGVSRGQRAAGALVSVKLELEVARQPSDVSAAAMNAN
jgi:polyisoprenoid-binding protein YceI